MKTDLKISFEFFPPKNQKMQQKLWNTLNKLKIIGIWGLNQLL